MFEDYKENIFNYINGQYAFAIWDRAEQRLFLGRDHVGICPLYYLSNNYEFAFASEIKALFQIPEIEPGLNYKSLIQIFTFWTTLPGETVFNNIFEIKPGYYAWVDKNKLNQYPYWKPNFNENGHRACKISEITHELEFLLENAVKLRLRSDVPVGAYLSGGLDSSIITALIKQKTDTPLKTFSIGFQTDTYDETSYQEKVSSHLQTQHRAFLCNNKAIAKVLYDVIWHTEKPILRTAPAPLFLLSQKVNEEGYKVILTGEGADEFFSGYNIYKETKIRSFNAKQPESRIRPLLFETLYPFIGKRNNKTHHFWQQFFQANLFDTNDPFYSHRIRWKNGVFLSSFLNPDVLNMVSDYDPTDALSSQVNPNLQNLSILSRAHFLESYLFLSNYLLSSQGDRILMSHSVEGRFPFLDRHVIDFANSLPHSLKMKVLKEKWILKQTFTPLLPQAIIKRKKQPYRAPIKEVYRNGINFLEYFVSTKTIEQDGIFQSKKVDLLKRKFESKNQIVSEREEMALIGILTTEMLNDLFIKHSTKKEQSIDQRWTIFNRRSRSVKKTAVI